MQDLDFVLRKLCGDIGASFLDLDSVKWCDHECGLKSEFAVNHLAAATVAAQALSAAAIWKQRRSIPQTVTVSVRHALALFRSERYLRVNGSAPTDPWSPLSGFYECGDGRWVQLHTNFDHHRDGVLRVLDCVNSRDAVARAIAKWEAARLDNSLAEAGLCAAMVRTRDEWHEHAQAQALAELPLMQIIKVGDAPIEPFRKAPTMPLSGVRVLDLSRIIAMPVGARTLAQHGADVLAIGAEHLPNIESLVIDTLRGKRSANVDLRTADGVNRLKHLVSESDVFMQAYRPGALAEHGFSVDEMVKLRPGLVVVELSAYGHVGPWAKRRGFDSLVQSASGIAWKEGLAAGGASPGRLPCQALDHGSGMLAALGAMMALHKRATEGGSWLVRLSLARTGQWLQSLHVEDPPDRELDSEEIGRFSVPTDSDYGKISAIAPVEFMSETSPLRAMPSCRLGSSAPVWLSR